MTPPEFLRFFKTKSGKLLLFAAVFAAGLTIFSVFRGRTHGQDEGNPPKPSRQTNNPFGPPQVIHTVERQGMAFHPPPDKPEPQSRSETASSPVTNEASKSAAQRTTQSLVQKVETPFQPLPSISLVADTSAGISEPRSLSTVFAPYGRLISCETVITVDSASMQTPIIGLVTEDVYHAGKLVIPAGTEVHGTAQTDRHRDRIASGTSWTFVWQTGEELHLKAIALDREFSGNQEGWAITDGSAGLRGEIIKADNMAEIKLFAATFLSGAASALTEKQETVFGPVAAPSLNNAPFQGAQSVLSAYAQQIYDAIQRDGYYVRVPSGKQFYLYVIQTIDRADAILGGSASSAGDDSTPPLTAPEQLTARTAASTSPHSHSTPVFAP